MTEKRKGPSRDQVLGLKIHAPAADGIKIAAGQRVRLTGRVMRIHESGFCAVEVEGDESQPAVIVRSGNLERIE